MRFPELKDCTKEPSFHARCTALQRPRALAPAGGRSPRLGRADEHRADQEADAQDRRRLRRSCRQRGYVLHRPAFRQTPHQRDEGELTLQQCRLLALANSLMRLRGWPVAGIGSAEGFSAAISESCGGQRGGQGATAIYILDTMTNNGYEF